MTAYNGAICSVENAGLLTAGASTTTVEARHASLLNLLDGWPPFPDAFDDARSRSDVEAITADSIVDEDEESDGDGHDGDDGEAEDSNGSKNKDDEDDEHD